MKTNAVLYLKRVVRPLRSPLAVIAVLSAALVLMPIGVSVVSAATQAPKKATVTDTYWLFLGGRNGTPVHVVPASAKEPTKVPSAIDTPDGTILNKCGDKYTMPGGGTYDYSCWPRDGASLTVAELDVSGKKQKMGDLSVPTTIGWTQILGAPAGELYANCLEFNPVYGSTKVIDYLHFYLKGPHAGSYVKATVNTCVKG